MFRLRRENSPRLVEVMPDGFTFEEALDEATYLASLGKTGIEAEVVVDPRQFVVLTTEGERVEVVNG